MITSDVQGAGTNANVFLSVYGSKAVVEKFALKESLNHRDKFERGQTDTFKLSAPFLGSLQKIRIWHDGKGLQPSWHLHQVEITHQKTGNKWLFQCGKWLAKDKGDSLTEREINVSTSSEPVKVEDSESTSSSDEDAKGFTRGRLLFPPVVGGRPSVWSVYDYGDLGLDLPYLPPGPAVYQALDAANRRRRQPLPIGNFDVWRGAQQTGEEEEEDGDGEAGKKGKKGKKKSKKKHKHSSSDSDSSSSSSSSSGSSSSSSDGESRRKKKSKKKKKKKKESKKSKSKGESDDGESSDGRKTGRDGWVASLWRCGTLMWPGIASFRSGGCLRTSPFRGTSRSTGRSVYCGAHVP